MHNGASFGGRGALDLPQEWRVRSDAYGWRSTARIGGMLAALVAAAPLTALYVSPWALLGLAPLLGAQIYKMTILMHDCVHGTLFASRRWNRVVGGLAAALTGVEFRTFARLHARHHREYGRTDDPQGLDYLGIADATRWRLAWHLLGPLTGWGVIKLLELRSPPGIAHDPGRRRHFLWFCAAQSVVAVAVTAGGRLWWLLPFYPACAATFGLFCSRVRGFCEHVAYAGERPEGAVRSHAPNRIDALFFYDLGFNYHVEHHLYPTVPSRHLAPLHAYLRARQEPRLRLSPSLARTIARRLASAKWRRQPGPGQAADAPLGW
jgi:fatty acid desaturase